MSDRAIKNLAPRDPSQKPPSSLESAFNTEKNDATIVGIGLQQLEKNTTASRGTNITGSNDVNDDNGTILNKTEYIQITIIKIESYMLYLC